MKPPTCPHCHDEVSLPLGANPDATVRCPLCRETFALHEILDTLPPLLEVVDEGTGSVSAGSTLGAGIDAFDDRSAEDLAFIEGAFDFDTGDEKSTAAAAGLEAKKASADADTADPKRKTRRSQRAPKTARGRTAPRAANPLAEIVKIVLGGVVGLGIGYYILLWIGKDPIGVAPKIAQIDIIKYVLPPRFRRAELTNSANIDTSSQDLTGEIFPSGEDQPGNQQQNATHPGPNNEEQNAQPNGGQTRPGSLMEVGIEIPEIDDQRRTSWMPLADRIVDATTTWPTKFDNALRDADQANQQWEADQTSSTGEARSKMAVRLYESLARLSEAASLLSRTDRNLRRREKDLQSLLDRLASEKGKLRLLGQGANHWLDAEQRANRGFLLVGKAHGVRTRGDLFVSDIVLQHSSKRPISVLSYHNPGEIGDSSNKLFVLGCFVDDPKTNLKGYQGKNHQVLVASQFTLVNEKVQDEKSDP